MKALFILVGFLLYLASGVMCLYGIVYMVFESFWTGLAIAVLVPVGLWFAGLLCFVIGSDG